MVIKCLIAKSCLVICCELTIWSIKYGTIFRSVEKKLVMCFLTTMTIDPNLMPISYH